MNLIDVIVLLYFHEFVSISRLYRVRFLFPLDDSFVFSPRKFTWNETHETRTCRSKRSRCTRFFSSKRSTYFSTSFTEIRGTICAPCQHTRQTETWVLLSSSFTAAIPSLRAHVWLGLSVYYCSIPITYLFFFSVRLFVCLSLHSSMHTRTYVCVSYGIFSYLT